jgi:beta-galactosidase
MKGLKNTLLALALLSPAALSFTRAADAKTEAPAKTAPLSLNGEWQFLLKPDEDAADALGKFYADGFDATAFKPIPVPANWTTEGFEEPHYINGTKSEGFYLHSFDVPASAKNQRALLHFGGVWQSAEVWLNGTRLGRHDSGFTSFAFDVTKALRPGEKNMLAVRVRQQTRTFKLDANDDWGLPGIYRDVSLEFTPKDFFIERVDVVTDFDAEYKDAELRIRTLVARDEKADFFSTSAPFEIHAALSTTEGKLVQDASVTATITGAHNGRDIPLTMLVRAPAAWTAETPALYDLTIELRREGKVLHAWSDRIGFREISTAGGIFRINGQAVKLRGVARHDQHPDVGRATRREHWLQDISLMKAANINAVRTSHYPPAEGFIRLCDERGLYVLEEVPFGFGGDRLRDPSLDAGVFLRVYETVNRDRNRPSVVVWDVGNEDPLTALHVSALRALKGLDPTRPTLLPFHGEEGLPPEVDILAPHYWKAEEYDRLAATATRPIITTEYSHALGPDDFGEQQERWDALTQHPAGAGGMIWMWADQGLRRKINGRDVFDPMLDKKKYTREGSELVKEKSAGKDEIYDSHGNNGTDGIVDADRAPQSDYWETKAAYAPVRTLETRVPFTPGQAEVVVTVRNDYDFTDLSTVAMTWKLYRGAAIAATGDMKLPATPPHAAVRIAIPTTAIARDAGGEVSYLHLFFTDKNGLQIAQRSVRLDEVVTTAAASTAGVNGDIKAEKQGDALSVTAGASHYVFNAKTGELDALEIAGEKTLAGATLAVWRNPTYSEANVLDRRERTYTWKTFLQNLPPVAKSWAFTQDADGVRVTTSVDYRADERNDVTVDYVYRVTADGKLTVDYVVKPTLDLPWLLEIGLSLKTLDVPQTISWLGYGPGASLPNRHGNALFGQWMSPVFSGESRGTKAGVEWLRLAGSDGRALQITGEEGFRLDVAKGGATTLRVLTHIAGAWVKGGPAERPEWRLDLKDGTGEFKGSLMFAPIIDANAGKALEHAGDLPQNPAVIGGGIINESPTYPSCHASTIAEISPGVLGAAWFGGTRERHPDVGIWFARFENGKWEPAREVANGVLSADKREPTWNPVLFQPKKGPLVLFYKVGPSPSQWWGMMMTSTDGGKTWSEPRRLPDGILGPIKNKPVQLADGAWLSPSSTEGNKDGWRVHFEYSADAGKTWKILSEVPKGAKDFDAIQPSILFHKDGRLQTLCRTKEGVLATSWSSDQGKTWTPFEASELPNPNSGTDAVTLADGRQLIVYNHTAPPPERPTKGVRYPLDVGLSTDGVHWQRVLTLETEPCAAGYAYPAVIQGSDGRIHITYTWDRKRIKHVVLDPKKL